MNLQYLQKLWNVCYLIFMLFSAQTCSFFHKSATHKKAGMKQYLCSSAKYEHKY